MTITEIRNILESPYNRKLWIFFLQTQFTNNKLNTADRPISLSDKTLSKQCLSMENYELDGAFNNERTISTTIEKYLSGFIADEFHGYKFSDKPTY